MDDASLRGFDVWASGPIKLEYFRHLPGPRMCGFCQARETRLARESDGTPSCSDCFARSVKGEPAAEPRLTDEEEARRLATIARWAVTAVGPWSTDGRDEPTQ